MMRYLALAVLLVGGFVCSAGSASAQFMTPGLTYVQPVNPYWRPGVQILGTLPGAIVTNPWNIYNRYPNYYTGFAVYNYNPIPAYYGSLQQTYYNYLATAPYPYATGITTINREPGRFVPVAPDLAVNPITGTRLAPARGIALTNEGPFYRIPGSGSFTAWGAYMPGNGTYLNPFNGDLYNPGSGLVIHR
jgi:hypothetical protein